MANIPITQGSGTASVAAETVSGVSYQKIQLYGGGGSSIASIDPAGAVKVSIAGVVNIAGSVAATFSGNQSVSGTVDASVIGTVPVTQSGTVITSISGTVALSPSIFGASIIGTVPVTGATVANQSVSGTVGSSVIGTVPTTQSGTVITSVAGTPNVAITSVATANGGLPVWSPLGSRVQGTADLRGVQGASIVALAAAGASTFNYIDHVQVANFGSASVLVTIADNTTSILGYTIAPAGGGSNFRCFYKSAANSPVTASINGTASVLVSMQGFTSLT